MYNIKLSYEYDKIDGKLIDPKDKLYIYTYDQINNLKQSKLWINSIIDPKIGKSKYYKLYPTGDMDLTHGRKYIILPDYINVNSDIKKQYNLM